MLYRSCSYFFYHFLNSLFFLSFSFYPLYKYSWHLGLGEESSLNALHVNLNLSAHFKGYLLRPNDKLNTHRFRTKSYSPIFVLIVERMTEAAFGGILSRTTADSTSLYLYQIGIIKASYYYIIITY